MRHFSQIPTAATRLNIRKISTLHTSIFAKNPTNAGNGKQVCAANTPMLKASAQTCSAAA
jgi:hypothetical protein